MKPAADISRLLACADRDSLPEAPPNYPPMAAWPAFSDTKKILAAWRRSLRTDGGRRPVVYVHVPFCETLCRFCGFYKLPAATGAVDRFLDALEKEIAVAGPAFKGRPLRFLCIGGGTPSLLTVPQLDRLFRMLRAAFTITAKTRIAFESSPNTLDPVKLAFLKKSGVEWLAIGVQSFDPALLKTLNRRQDPVRALEAVKQAKKAGIKQVEVDLMTGLPGQTGESFLSDVKKVAALDVERVYLFDFQPRRNTSACAQAASLGAGELDEARALRRRAMDLLLARGYRMCCGHWVYKRKGDCWPYSYDQGEEGSYSVLGLGPSAVSYAMNGARYRNVSNEAAYERTLSRGALPASSGCLLSPRDEMVNFVLLDALQRGQVEKRKFSARFGRSLAGVFGAELAALADAGVLADAGRVFLVSDRVRATTELRRAFYSNEVVARLSELYGAGEAPAAAPGRAPRPAFNPVSGAHECPLQDGALGALLYGEAVGRARPGREVALDLLKAPAKREALLVSAAVPGSGELAAARYAAKSGFRKTVLFSPLPPPGFSARLKAAGVSGLLFPAGPAVTAAELKAVREARSAGLELSAVLVPGRESPARLAAALRALVAAGAKRVLLSFPEGKGNIKTDYAALARAARAAAGQGAWFLRAPFCVIPDFRRALDRRGEGAGDARESGGVKPKLCLHCRHLLDCPGPAAGYAEKYGFKGLKSIR